MSFISLAVWRSQLRQCPASLDNFLIRRHIGGTSFIVFFIIEIAMIVAFFLQLDDNIKVMLQRLGVSKLNKSREEGSDSDDESKGSSTIVC